MAYKVRQGDSWETLANQYPGIKDNNPTIKNIKPGMVLQTPMQTLQTYGMVSQPKATTFASEYGHTGFQGYGGGVGMNGGVTKGTVNEPILRLTSEMLGKKPVYGNPTQAPSDIRYQNPYGNPTTAPSDIKYQNMYNNPRGGTSLGQVLYDEKQTTLLGIAAQKAAEAAKTVETSVSTYTPPAKGQPGYNKWFALQGVLTARQIAKKRNGLRTTQSLADEGSLAQDSGAFGQFNWRI